MKEDLNPERRTDIDQDASAEALAQLIESQARSADATPEEAAELARLASASREWQSRLAARLAQTQVRTETRAAHSNSSVAVEHQAGAGRANGAGAGALQTGLDQTSEARAGKDQEAAIRLVSGPAKNRAQRFYVWAGAGLAASLVVAVALVGWQRMANTPERLLAEAYGHSRIFELRMPGADFARVTPQAHLRGSETGRESALLLDARSRIERHLENSPDDPHWLQLEARADVMEEKFDPAIDILDRLVAAGPVNREPVGG